MKQLLHCCVFTLIGVLFSAAAFAQPTANFSANITSGCGPIVVQFSDLSTGSPTSWNWNLGNGANSTLQNPSTTYITPGTYTVTLTASDAGGSNTKSLTGYISVLPAPVIQFAADDSSAGCAPRTVSFTNLAVPGTPGAATYSWDFGDGSTSTAANPTHTYTSNGNFTVTLVVTNSLGCTRVLTKPAYIPMSAKPAASFTASNTGSCFAPITTTFTNTSTGGVTYLWNFGDGTTSTAANPTKTYSTAGAYTVTLIVTNAAGCKDTLVAPSYISIGNLDAAFTQNVTTSCAGTAVSFTNTSIPGPGTSTWFFGDGGSQTSTNVSHVYTAAGTYTVKLRVVYSNCVDSAFSTVTVLPKPVAAFSGTNLFKCTPPLSTTFSNTSTGATSYLWLFGDGGTSTASNPTYTYTTAGTFTVKLVAIGASGCTDTATIPGYVKVGTPTGTATATPGNGCAPVAISFNATTNSTVAVSSYAWTFGNGATGTGQSPSYTYTVPGTYTATVTYTLATVPACTYTAQTTVNIGVKPTASFTAAPTTICVGQSVTFTNTSTGATSYAWSIGGGTVSTSTNPTIGFSQPGVYTVKLIASNNGCSDTEVIANMITVQGPQASFSAMLVNCASHKVLSFINNSTGGHTAFWDFGDGGTSTLQNPIHTYANYGIYTATLIVTDTVTGCTSIKTATITVFDLDAQFSANDTAICKGESVQFTAQTQWYYSNYSWDFGDATTGGGSTVSHTYNSNGSFTVRLIVTDVAGCKDTLIRLAYIKVSQAVPAFSGTPLSGCSPLLVAFSDASTAAPTGNSIVGRTWRFGNGQSLSGNSVSPSHTYATGIYSVTLVVTDAYGCKDSLLKPAYVLASRPTAAFSAPDTLLCPGESVSFVNASVGTPLTYNWTFGDGGTSTQASPSHAYGLPGAYTVRLIVTGAGGCKDTVTRTAYVQVVAAVPAFSMSDSFATCPPLAVQFTNNTTGALSYSWSLGNGSVSTQQNPSALYTLPGVYTVKLKTVSLAGCADSVTKTITVLGPTGTLSYTPQSGCAPITITFSSVAQNTASFTWDMNNGTTFTTTNSSTSYTYTTPGTFIPVVILSNGLGCNVGYQGLDTIRISKPVAGFSFGPDMLCNPATVQFTDTSATSAGSSITGWTWNFGNGATSTAQHPSTVFTAPGTYTVKLTLATSSGCVDSTTRQVTILPKPNGAVTGAGNACTGDTLTLQATGGTGYVWTPSTGLSCTTCANPTATVTGPQTYTVVTSDANGCSDTDQVVVNIFPQPVVAVNTPAAICSGTGSATLTASGASTYVWSPATGLSATTGATVTATPASTTTYTVTGISANGCVDTAQTTVTVNPTPVLTTNGPVQNVCNNATVTLTASGATTYSWSPATGLSCPTCSSTVVTPSGNITYTVTGTTGGCSTSAQIAVNVTSQPAVSAGPDTSFCTGGVALQAGGAATYVWSPATGLSCTTCANPTASPTATTTYTVTGTAPGGCVGTDQVTVAIAAPPTVSGGPSALICAGNSVQLGASGGTTYSWSPSTGLSCTTCANPTASPSATTLYTVTGTTSSGCFNTDTVTVSVTPNPVVTVSGPQAFCTGNNGVTLSASGADTYVWSPAGGLTCTTCASPVATPSSTTTYSVTGTSAAGCTSAPVTTTVTVNPLPAVSVGGGSTVCAGISATLTANGGVSYQWSPATGLSATTGATVVATPLTTTTYTVTGTSADGCSDTAHVTVTVTPLPTVSVLAPAPICAGGSATLQALGAASYVWTPGTALSCTTCAAPVANPTATTTYTVTGTAAGCTATAQVTLTVNPLPTITVAPVAAICPGSSVNLQAGGGASYVWSPGTGLSCTACASPTASPSTTTTYTVTGTGANGCTATNSVTVNVFPAAAISAGPDAGVCNGQSAQLQASGGLSYVWSPATALSCTTCAAPQAMPATSTTYTVTGTDANGCVGTDQVVVNIGQLPTINAGVDTAFCAGSSVLLTATGGSTYVWTPTAGLSCTTCPSPTASPATTTTYTVTGTNAQGCSGTDQVVVTVKALPAVVASAPVSICPGLSTTLGASGAVSYSWNPASTLSNSTIANPIATPTATTTYTVTGTGANGCTATNSVTVTVFPAAVISAGPDAAVCSGQPATLTASGGASYVWSPATGLSCTTCASPAASPATTTTYTVTGTTVNGCVDTDQVVVTVSSLPTVSAGPDAAVCAGMPASLQASGAVSYVWSPATGLSCTACANPSATPGSTTTYTVTGTNAAGCTGTDQMVVTVRPLPLVSAGPDRSYCAGGSATLQASGAATYAWSPAASLSCISCAAPVASPAATTTYTLTGTDAFGCVNTDAVTVTVNPLPQVSAGPDAAICEGTSTTLTASGAAVYGWSPGATLSCTACASPAASPVAATTYTVVGTDAAGCQGVDSVRVSIVPHVPTAVGPGDSVCKGGSVVLTASGGVSYQWSPSTGLSNTGGASVTATPEATTTYTVIIRENQCYSDTARVTVGVYPIPIINAGPDQYITAGSTANLFAQSTDATRWEWTPAENLSCTTCLTPVASPRRTTTYTIEASNEWECRATDDVTVYVTCDVAQQLFIPNTFTPNGDGQNDRFYPRGKGIDVVNRFRVYNRWGELVYEIRNTTLNDMNSGWDGTQRGVPLKPDVYVWMIDAQCEGGDQLQLKGDISLIR